MRTQLVTFEEGDLVVVERQTLGGGAADDPASDHDDPRHIRKIAVPRSSHLTREHSFGIFLFGLQLPPASSSEALKDAGTETRISH